MDLSNPNFRRDVIMVIFLEIAEISMEFILQLRPALEPLYNPPNYSEYELTNVDQYLLTNSLAEVAANLGSYADARRITRDRVVAAIRRSRCHYLWFC